MSGKCTCMIVMCEEEEEEPYSSKSTICHNVALQVGT